MAKVLVIDDEPSIREFLEILLRRQGHEVRLAVDAFDGIARLGEAPADLVLTDLRLPKGDGMDVLQHVAKHHQNTQVIMMTAFATTENAVEAMKLGAYDYIIKPFKPDALSAVIDRALERRALQDENVRLKETLDARHAQHRLLGTSTAMQEVFSLIGKVAGARTNVLLTGESGTGKELVARAIHNRGHRHAHPFVPINCGAIPETLIESELFGHMKGSFTGAVTDKLGLFEIAAAGTVFLDEIGDLPLPMQVRLLRVLQERKLKRVGGQEDVELDCRIIAATNRNLEREVREGRFREDLFFRLNVIEIELPPLRERRADIPALAEAFVAKFAEQQGSDIGQISSDAMVALTHYAWPGNVRELENAIERGVTLANGSILLLDELPVSVRESQSDGRPIPPTPVMKLELPETGFDLELVLEGIERDLLERALTRTGNKKKKAAALLGLSFRSFRYRVAKLGLKAPDGDAGPPGGGDDPSSDL